jgi:hypothetical protein
MHHRKHVNMTTAGVWRHCELQKARHMIPTHCVWRHCACVIATVHSWTRSRHFHSTAVWHVATGLLPSNALNKSITVWLPSLLGLESLSHSVKFMMTVSTTLFVAIRLWKCFRNPFRLQFVCRLYRHGSTSQCLQIWRCSLLHMLVTRVQVHLNYNGSGRSLATLLCDHVSLQYTLYILT